MMIMTTATASLEDKLATMYEGCTAEEQETLVAMFAMAAAVGAQDGDATDGEVEGFSVVGLEGGGGVGFEGGGGLGKVSITPIPIPGFDPGGGIVPISNQLLAAKLGTSLLTRIA